MTLLGTLGDNTVDVVNILPYSVWVRVGALRIEYSMYMYACES
jgi:hypothetical protein